MTPVKVYGCSELHKIVSKNLDFRKILKIHENKFVNWQNFVLLFHRRENDQRLNNSLKFK